MKQIQMRRLKTLVFIFMVIFISSCDDDVVGKWDPMEWKYENVGDGIKIIKSKGKSFTEIEVSKSGSVDIVCKNYKSIWFAEYPNMTEDNITDVFDYMYRFTTEFCDMTIKGETLHCEFFNIEQQNPEEFQIILTAGDIFNRFQIDIK